MPISDQVIELETKKKGRNALFIILIALFAAASVAFAVLWFFSSGKEGKPPTIEEISISSTDLCLVNNTDAEPVYTVSPQCTYTVAFDVKLSGVEAYVESENNPILQYQTDPENAITRLEGSGIDPENHNRYIFNFRVNNTVAVGTPVTVTLSSGYAAGESMKILLRVEQPYVEYFDVKKDANDAKTVHKGSSASSTTTLEDVGNSDATHKYYKLTLPYYKDDLSTLNNEDYILEFEQFGRLGMNGERAKITQTPTEYGGRFDQVKVEVSDAKDGTFKELDSTFAKTSNLTLDLNPQSGSSGYCRNMLSFSTAKAATSTIRLTANAYNGGTPYQIILYVTFASTDESDAVTQIIFKDPYSGRVADAFDLYLDDFSSSGMFDVAQFVTVVIGGKEQTATWGNNALVGVVSNASGAALGPTDEALVRKGVATEGKFAIHPTSTFKTGDAYLTIRDNDKQGYGVSKTLTVHVRPKVTAFTIDGKEATKIEMYAGQRQSDVTAAYAVKVNMGATLKEMADDVNTTLAVGYSHANVKPTFTMTGTVNNKAKAIVVRNMEADYTVFTKAAEDPDRKDVLTAPIEIEVGAQVDGGSYELTFTMHAQQLSKDRDKDSYSKYNEYSCKITIEVIRLASALGINEEDFADTTSELYASADKYTELTGTGTAPGTTATLTLAVGEGTAVGSKAYTTFGLRDIIQFYEEGEKKGEYKSVAFSSANFAALELSALDNAKLSDIIETSPDKGYRFVVPTAARDDLQLRVSLDTYNLTITVQYKYVVGSIEVSSKQSVYYRSYNKADLGSQGFFLGNGDNDTLIVKSTKGVVLTDIKNVLGQIMHPERFAVDVVILRGGNAQYLLPKKPIATTVTVDGQQKQITSVYYFAPGTADADMNASTVNNALFRCGYLNPLESLGDSKAYNITVMKDLFYYSVQDSSSVNPQNADRDFGDIRIYYSYGDVFEKENGRTITKVGELADSGNYKAVRRFDEVRLYADEQCADEDEIQKDEQSGRYTVSYPSGREFAFYASGVIIFADGTEWVERQAQRTVNEHRLLCSSLRDYEISAGNTNITSSGNNTFTVTCTEGQSNVYCGYITVKEQMYSADADFRTAELFVYASNNSVPVSAIRVYSDEQRHNAVTKAWYLYNNGTNRSVTLYYEVDFAAFDSNASSAFNEFYFRDAESAFLKSNNSLDTFNFAVSAHPGSTAGYTYEGYVTLTLAESKGNGVYTFEILAPGQPDKTIVVTFVVTTLINKNAFGVQANNTAQTEIGFVQKDSAEDAALAASPVSLTYNLAANASAVTAEFTVNFATTFGVVDKNNLMFSFDVALSDISAQGFYSQAGNLLAAITAVKGADVYSFRITFNGVAVKDKVLTLTVHEQVEDHDVTYVLYVKITVNVPTQKAELTIGSGDDAVTFASTDKNRSYEIVWNNRSQAASFPLAVRLNDGESRKQPATVGYAFNLPTNNIFSVEENDGAYTLVVDYTKLTRTTETVALTLTVTDATDTQCTLTVQLTLTDAFKTARLRNANLRTDTAKYLHTSNVSIDGALETKGEKELDTAYALATANVTYSLDKTVTGVSLNTSTGLITLNDVSDATFTLTAVYNDGIVTFTFAVEITVKIPADNITVTDRNNKAVADASGYFLLLKGQTLGGFTATVNGASGLTPAVTGVGVSSSNSGVVDVTRTDNTFSLRAVAAGTATVTVTAADNENVTFTFTVEVLAPMLTVHAEAASYDVLQSDTVFFTVSLTQNVATQSNMQYSLNDVTDLTVQVNGTVFKTVTRVGGANNRFKVEIDKSKLDENALTDYTVTVSGKIGTIALATESDVFALAMGAWTPTFTVKEAGLEELAPDKNGKLQMSSRGDKEYHFVLSDADARKLAEFDADAYEITLTTVPGVITDYEITATQGIPHVKINAFRRNFMGNVTATLTVCLLDRDFKCIINNIVLTDSMEISSALYQGHADNLSVNDSGVMGTALAGSMAMDYADATEKAALQVTLVVNLSSAPIIAGNVAAADFVVGAAGGLQPIQNTRRIVGGNRFFMVTYNVLTPGSAAAFAQITVGGVTLTAQETLVLTPTEPAFTLRDDNATVTAVSMSPGDSKALTVQHAASFKGAVQYTVTQSVNTFVTCTVNKDTGALSITAKKAVGGGATLVSVMAAVTSGAFADKTYVMPVTVTVQDAAAPTASAQNAVIRGGETIADLSTYVQVIGKDGNAVPASGYTLVFAGDYVTESESLYVFAAPASFSGERIVSYTVTMGSAYANGWYEGYELSGTFTVCVAPQSASFTAIGATTSVLPGDTLDFAVTVGSLDAADYVVGYSLGNPSAGSFTGSVFTANAYAGNVTVTATVTVVRGAFAGVEYTLIKTVTVRGFNTKTLNGEPNGTVTLPSALPIGADGTVTVGAYERVTPSDSCVTFPQNTKTLTIARDANYGTTDKTVTLQVVVADADGVQYSGILTLTIGAVKLPTLSVSDLTEESNQVVFTLNGGNTIAGARYKLQVLQGDNLIQAVPETYLTYGTATRFAFTPRTDTAGGTVIVKISMQLAGDAYADVVIDEQIHSFTVEGAQKPSITDVSFAKYSSNDGGTINVTVANATQYTYVLVYDVSAQDAQYISVDANGKVVFKKSTEAKTVTVGVSAIFTGTTGAPYDKILVTAENPLTITVPKEETATSTLTANINYAEAKIVVTRNNLVSTSYVLADAANSKYITLCADGSFTLDYAALKAANMLDGGIDVNITVTYSTTSWGQTTYRTESKTVTVEVSKAVALLPQVDNSLTMTPDEDDPLTGTLDYAADGLEILSYKTASDYISISGESYTLTPDTDKHESEKITVTYRITAGAFKGTVFEKEHTVTVEAQEQEEETPAPNPTPEPAPEEGENE